MAPVAVGLFVGIALVVLFSTFFSPAYTAPILEGEYHPTPGRIADKALQIAMQNSTLQQLFEGREIVVMSIRDWGIAGGSECPIGWCAIILFDDKSDDLATGFAAATVSVKSAKVVNISLHKDILIAKTKETGEVKYFLSKYPDAQVDVQRNGSRVAVIYTIITRQAEGPSGSYEGMRT